ncbi:MAG: T9SS type A sorting domain-containing protein, partial [Bacteroidota bacterium]|nr:T9SS type A sorting domain-containing protein [Bacteroidota bacterium]
SPLSQNKRQVYRISLIASTGIGSSFSYIGDQDSLISASNILSPKESDYEIKGAIANYFSKLPPYLTADFSIYGWHNAPYAIVKVKVINRDTLLKDMNIFIGFEFLPQIDSTFGFETIQYDRHQKIITSFRKNSSSTFTALKFLDSDLLSLRMLDWKDYYDRGTGSDSLIFSLMSSKVIDDSITGGADGAACLFSQDALPLKLYDSTFIYLAIAVGNSMSEAISNINESQNRYFRALGIGSYRSKSIPSEYKLMQNFPNPFNPSTSISFSIPQRHFVSLKLYDLLGREVAQIISSEFEAGTHTIKFAPRDIPSGVYLYKLESGSHILSRKMVIIR